MASLWMTVRTATLMKTAVMKTPPQRRTRRRTRRRRVSEATPTARKSKKCSIVVYNAKPLYEMQC